MFETLLSAITLENVIYVILMCFIHVAERSGSARESVIFYDENDCRISSYAVACSIFTLLSFGLNGDKPTEEGAILVWFICCMMSAVPAIIGMIFMGMTLYSATVHNRSVLIGLVVFTAKIFYSVPIVVLDLINRFKTPAQRELMKCNDAMRRNLVNGPDVYIAKGWILPPCTKRNF